MRKQLVFKLKQEEKTSGIFYGQVGKSLDILCSVAYLVLMIFYWKTSPKTWLFVS